MNDKITHERSQFYFGGRWYWRETTVIFRPDYVARLYSTYAGYGDNSRKWFYADYQMRPNFSNVTRFRFDGPSPEPPF